MLIKDLMTPNPICGRPDMPVTEAQALMQQHNFRHLPILDAEGKLVGLITQRSLAHAIPSDVRQFSPFVINCPGQGEGAEYHGQRRDHD